MGILDRVRGPIIVPCLVREIGPKDGPIKDWRKYLCPFPKADEEFLYAGRVGEGTRQQKGMVLTE